MTGAEDTARRVLLSFFVASGLHSHRLAGAVYSTSDPRHFREHTLFLSRPVLRDAGEALEAVWSTGGPTALNTCCELLCKQDMNSCVQATKHVCLFDFIVHQLTQIVKSSSSFNLKHQLFL